MVGRGGEDSPLAPHLEHMGNDENIALPQKLNAEELRDEEILTLSLRNPSQFETIVSRYQEAFIRKAKSFVKSSDDAADLVQETFVKIYLNAGRFRPVAGASFKSWAYKILVNTCLTFLKKQKREHELTLELEPEVYESIPDTKSNTGEMRLLLDEALSVFSRIPNTAADILDAYFVKGKSQQEIARDNGISVGAVRTRIHRARKEFDRVSADVVS